MILPFKVPLPWKLNILTDTPSPSATLLVPFKSGVSPAPAPKRQIPISAFTLLCASIAPLAWYSSITVPTRYTVALCSFCAKNSAIWFKLVSPDASSVYAPQILSFSNSLKALSYRTGHPTWIPRLKTSVSFFAPISIYKPPIPSAFCLSSGLKAW